MCTRDGVEMNYKHRCLVQYPEWENKTLWKQKRKGTLKSIDSGLRKHWTSVMIKGQSLLKA